MERKTGVSHLESRYFQRMASSVGDKAQLVNYLPPVVDFDNPPSVADIGAGGGEFSFMLTQMGYKVTAVDVSSDALALIEKNYPEVDTVETLANHLDDLGSELFDAVVCSSVLHEVYSYGDDYHKAGHLSSLERAFKAVRSVLKPQGVLLIRDGVKPADWAVEGVLTLNSSLDRQVVDDYLRQCPFSNEEAYGNQGSMIKLSPIGNNSWAGNLQSIMEFSYTYTWGVESYPREAKELYGVMTLNEYANFIEKTGFEVLESFSYLQPGYPEHLANKLEVTVEGSPIEWFDSNAIWVAQKK